MKHHYIISFGASDSYRLSSDDCISKVKDKIKAFLTEKFPDVTGLKYFEHPDVKEIKASETDKNDGYPELDSAAVAKIEKCLKKEVEAKEAVKELNSNALFSNDY